MPTFGAGPGMLAGFDSVSKGFGPGKVDENRRCLGNIWENAALAARKYIQLVQPCKPDLVSTSLGDSVDLVVHSRVRRL